MSRDKTAAALLAVMGQPEKRTKAARFREVADLVEQASAAGVSRKTIVEVLAGQDLQLSEATLNSYLTRARKARAGQSPTAAPAAALRPAENASALPPAPPEAAAAPLSPESPSGLRSILRADADVIGAQRRMAAQLRTKAQGA